MHRMRRASAHRSVLIYSHGLISFASENSMLMEYLASHGYLVIALQHVDQLAELRELQRAQPRGEKQEQARLQRKLKASSVSERAGLSKEYFRIASNTNRIVSGRCVDVEYAVSALESITGVIPRVDGIYRYAARRGDRAYRLAALWPRSMRNGTAKKWAAS